MRLVIEFYPTVKAQSKVCVTWPQLIIVKVHYNFCFIKFPWKMIDHGSRSTWGQGPTRSRLRTQKWDLPPRKKVHFIIWLIIFYQVQAAEPLQPHLAPPPWFLD
jgi:hypothetical protein